MSTTVTETKIGNDVSQYTTTSAETDSVELKRSGKAEYSWSIKVYFDSGNNTSTALERIHIIDSELRSAYLQ